MLSVKKKVAPRSPAGASDPKVSLFTNSMIFVIIAGLVVLIAFTVQLGLERTGDPFNMMDTLPIKLPSGVMESIGLGWAVVVVEAAVRRRMMRWRISHAKKEIRSTCLGRKRHKSRQKTLLKVPIRKGRRGKCLCLSARIGTSSVRLATMGECERNPG